MPDVGGINVIVDMDTMQPVAQRLVCWDRSDGPPDQTIQYRTDGNLPYFRVPAGTCQGKDPLTLIPGGTAIPCNTTGAPTVIRPTLAEVSGLNPNSCREIPAPGGLAAQGTPTQTAITVGWEAPASGAAPTGYRVTYRKDGSTGAWTVIDVPAATLTATASGLTAGTAYVFRVQARQGDYLSPPTAEVTVSTAAAA